MVKWEYKSKYGFEDLRKVMDILRSEGGCPWDREQTHESLKEGTLEECYEVVEAIDKKDYANLKEELGDLLLHVVFHSKIAEQNNEFNLDTVIHELVAKLIRRHPHVFADVKADSADEVVETWGEVKQKEHQYTSYADKLVQIPKAMPALMRAYKVQKKAAKVGFDFPDWKTAYNKIYEEIQEFESEILENKTEKIEEEYGDLLFSLVNVSRFFQINPEISLTNATEKFINRFKGIEEMANSKGLELNELSIYEMDKLWGEFKNLTPLS